MSSIEARVKALEEALEAEIRATADGGDWIGERYPDLDEAQRTTVIYQAISVLMAAYTRLDIRVYGDHNEHLDGDPGDIAAARRAFELAMDEAAERARRGDASEPPRYCDCGPGADPEFPRQIDALLARARNTP